MSLEVVWEYLKEKREKEEIEKLDQMVVVPDSFKSMEYVLTHRFVNSSSAFIGKDQNDNKLHVKICTVPSFDDVKSIHKNLKLVSDCQIDLQLVPVIEIIEFYEGNRWVVLLISPYFEGFTLEELSEALHLHGFFLDKNTGISVFLSILDIIKVADSKAAFIISTMPDNVFFIRNTIGANGIISTETASYELKILATSRQWLFCGHSRIEKLYPSSQKRNHVDGMIWGAGLCLYGLVSSQALSTLPALNEINDTERGELLKFHFEDEALSYIIKHSLKNTKPQSFTSHPYIKLWRALLGLNWEGIEACSISQILALLSGLTFERLECRLLAMKRVLFIIQDNSIEVYKSLVKQNMLLVFIEMSLYFDWYGEPNLLNSVFLVLKEKTMARNFKEKLVSMNFLSVVLMAIDLQINGDLLCQFISKFSEDNTLTLLQIIWSSGFPLSLLAKPNRTQIELDFIKDTMSYYGPHSVGFIKQVYESIEISENRINQHLLETPYYFKLEESQILVKTMMKIIERNPRNQGDSAIDILKTIVLILAELLCVPKLLQYHHVISQCPSSSPRLFLSEVGRNPLLAKCKQCGTSYCVMCIAANHKNHDIQYINYLNAYTRCQSVSQTSMSTEIGIFRLPRYPAKISLIDSNGKIIINQSFPRFTGSNSISITTVESLNATNELGEPTTLLYFEVKVDKAGLQENIVIGIDGCDVLYKSTDGGIYVKGMLMGKAKRFGSYDTVGIGVTSTGKAYTTYNGLVNWPMVDCQLVETMKPVVIINSEDYDIYIKLRNWMFQPTSDLSSNQDFSNKEVLNICDKLLSTLSDVIKKNYKKNPNDIKTKDLLNKYEEILGVVKKFGLIVRPGNKRGLW